MPPSTSYNPITEVNSKIEKPQSSSLTNLPTQSNNIPLNSSNSCIATPVTALQPAYSQPLPQNFNATEGSFSQLRRVSLSDASVNQGSQLSMQDNRNLLETKPVCSVLPVYRQAPDYDTAVKLKYGVQRYDLMLQNFVYHCEIKNA